MPLLFEMEQIFRRWMMFSGHATTSGEEAFGVGMNTAPRLPAFNEGAVS